MAVQELQRQFLPDRSLFAFRLVRRGEELVVEGTSVRYSAIVLLGLSRAPNAAMLDILRDQRPRDVYTACLKEVRQVPELGAVALAAWAGQAIGDERAEEAMEIMWSLVSSRPLLPTVETSWALSALSVAPVDGRWATRRSAIAQRLLDAAHPQTGLFSHWLDGHGPWGRRHVCCFADMVYPVLALSRYAQATGDVSALTAAGRCAEQMVAAQGPKGQWWWHFDVRTGRVIERYPVYAVHQDGMAPMALRTLRLAGGRNYAAAIRRGLDWLEHSPEIGGSLVDGPEGVIWRKVARHESGKACRKIQATASRVHPVLRVPGLGLTCPPGRIDWETRPYHMGWILYAWPEGRQLSPDQPAEMGIYL
jgi:hypothetical protein